jgi:AraC-like DNA-binding protein
MYLIALSLITNKKSNSLPNITLSIFLFLRGSILLIATFAEHKQINAIKLSVWVVPFFNYLLPIVSYYYIRSVIDSAYKISGKELLYLLFLLPLPVIYIWGSLYFRPISYNDIVMFLDSSDSLKDVFLFGQRKFIILYRVSLQFAFGLYIYNAFKNNSATLNATNKYKWLNSFIFIYFLFFTISLLQIILYFNYMATIGSMASMNILKYGSIIAAYTLLYFIINNPSVIYGHMFTYDHVDDNDSKVLKSENVPDKADSSIIFENEHLKENEIKLCKNKSETYFSELSCFLTESKVYLKQDLTIAELSTQAKIPSNYLSFSISQNVGKNFREYINDLRIQHFIAEYETLSDKYTIDIIAEQSGFRSKATFYTAFKRYTGKTPADYFKSLGNKQYA